MIAVAYERRREMYPVIAWMRDDCGLTWKEIGAQLGMHLKTAHDYYHDRTGARHHERQMRWRPKDHRPCPTCDGQIHGSSYRRGARRCVRCMRAEEEKYRAPLVELRRADFSNREIAELLGIPVANVANTLSRARKHDPSIPVDRYMRKGERGRL